MKTEHLFGFDLPYISTENWVVLSALFFFLTFLSVWVLFGRGPLVHFFISSFCKPDGRADEKKLTMFAILTMYLFLHVRGAIVGTWMPEYVFWGLTGLIAVWLGLAYEFLKVKEKVEVERQKMLTTNTTEVKVTESKTEDNA